MSDFLPLYIDCLVFLFGAVVGSFLNVCIYRMPRGLSVVSPPSACPHCHTQIRWYHNIPLVTYLAIGGKCRYCGAKITPRYFLVELLTALAFLAVWLQFGSWRPVIYWVLIAGFIVATFIDFEHFIIPNEITLGGVVVGLVASAVYPPLHDALSVPASIGQSLLGILCGGGVLYLVVELGKLLFGKRKVPLDPDTKIVIHDGKLIVGEEELPWEDMFFRDSDRITFRATTLQYNDQTFADAQVVVTETGLQINDQKFDLTATDNIEATTDLIIIPREAMGLGDVKLLAAIGAFLGWKATLFTVFISSVLGGVVGLALIILQRTNWQGRIPYGPYLVVGALLWIFFGQQLVYWYMNFLRG
jgi:leader peptidase (prepilin peptidase)/N-methyltransferase